MYSFTDLIRRTPPPTFSDTAVTDRHSDTTFFPAQSSPGADILVYWIGKIVRTCAPGGSRTLDLLRARRAPYPLGQAFRYFAVHIFLWLFIGHQYITLYYISWVSDFTIYTPLLSTKYFILSKVYTHEGGIIFHTEQGLYS